MYAIKLTFAVYSSVRKLVVILAAFLHCSLGTTVLRAMTGSRRCIEDGEPSKQFADDEPTVSFSLLQSKTLRKGTDLQRTGSRRNYLFAICLRSHP